MSTANPMSKYPSVPSRIRRTFERPAADAVKTLARYAVSDLCDVVGNMYTMRGIRSLYSPGTPMCGVAMTVKCPPGDNLGIMRAITMLRPGDVVVVDAQGFVEYCLGGFRVIEYAVRKGALGFVIHGAYRDVEEAAAAKLPLYGCGVSPGTGPKSGPFEINVPVCCGGVIVEPGDVVSASTEGLVVVPRMFVDTVCDKLRSAEESGNSSIDPDKERAYTERYFNSVAAYVDESFVEGDGVYLDRQ
jgi:regulator of RNase E activity RraA